jgi:hypothetical protein
MVMEIDPVITLPAKELQGGDNRVTIHERVRPIVGFSENFTCPER